MRKLALHDTQGESGTDVSETDIKVQVSRHSSNSGVREIGSVNQADAIHETQDNNQTSVNNMDDTSLLLQAEFDIIVDFA